MTHGIRTQYRRLHGRTWASPTPSQNLVRSTNGMDPIDLKSGRVLTQDPGGNRCLCSLHMAVSLSIR